MESLHGGAQCVYRTWKRITPRLVLVEPTWGILCLNQLHTCCIRREDQHQDEKMKKKVAEKIKIMMRRKRRVAAMRRPTQGWEDAEKISWKKSCSPSDRNLDPLLCSPTPHAVEAGRRILGKIRSQRPGRTCFYLLFLLMFICYLPARTCFYLLFFLLVICSLPFLDALASLKAMLDIK